MGLFATVTVEWPLPDGGEGGEFRTEDPADLFAAYRLGADGLLWRSLHEAREVPPGEPRFLGMDTYLQRTGEAASDFSGYLSLRALGGEDRSYVARLEGGRLLGIRAGGLEGWADEARDARHALEILRGMLAPGQEPNRDQLRAFVEAALARLPPTSDRP